MMHLIENLLAPLLMILIPTQQGRKLMIRDTPTLPVSRVENPYWSQVPLLRRITV